MFRAAIGVCGIMSSSFTVYTLGIVLTFSSVVMILLVLIQRGRGGGLAGAFGGQGGQSALGVRAGDIFTKITIGVAVVWVLVAGLLGISMRAKAANDKAGTVLELAEDDPETEASADGEAAPEVKTADEPTDPAAAGGPLVTPAEPVPAKPENSATEAEAKPADTESAEEAAAEKPSEEKTETTEEAAKTEPAPTETSEAEEAAKTEEAAPKVDEPKVEAPAEPVTEATKPE